MSEILRAAPDREVAAPGQPAVQGRNEILV